MLLFIYYSPSKVTNTLMISFSINSLVTHLFKNSKKLFFTLATLPLHADMTPPSQEIITQEIYFLQHVYFSAVPSLLISLLNFTSSISHFLTNSGWKCYGLKSVSPPQNTLESKLPNISEYDNVWR